MYVHATETSTLEPAMTPMTRALIYLDNLRFNYRQIFQRLPKGTLICPAVKANAYGHGAVEISRILKDEGAHYLAVARVSEGMELRKAGIKGPILLLGHITPIEISEMIRWELTALAGSLDYLELLEERAKAAEKKLHVHLKVDTGMGRLGCTVSESLKLAEYIHRSPWLNQQGLCSHFPVADSPEKKDQDFTRQQQKTMEQLLLNLQEHNLDPGILHYSNSGGILMLNEQAEMVRPGIALYGYTPDQRIREKAELKPVMELECPITFIKKFPKGKGLSYGLNWTAQEDCYIATLPVGYADGYSRGLSNKGQVWIGGNLYPVVGRVCMDYIMVNLGSTTNVELYDRAVLFGPTKGAPTAADLAMNLGTIPYEITCGINSRVPRIPC